MKEYLYHYTSADNAMKIIDSKYLLFSKIENANDIYESCRVVFYNLSNIAMDVATILKQFQQLSFVKDTAELRGFCIPSMWGHYSDKGNGVCMVFNKKKLLACCSKGMYHDSVEYRKNYDPDIEVDNTNIDEYLRLYKKKLFFRKSIDWAPEQEYRIITQTQVNTRKRLYFKDSLHSIILYNASDVKKNDSVFNSKKMHDLMSIIPQNKVYELGWWEGIPNLRDNAGQQISL